MSAQENRAVQRPTNNQNIPYSSSASRSSKTLWEKFPPSARTAFKPFFKLGRQISRYLGRLGHNRLPNLARTSSGDAYRESTTTTMGCYLLFALFNSAERSRTHVICHTSRNKACSDNLASGLQSACCMRCNGIRLADTGLRNDLCQNDCLQAYRSVFCSVSDCYDIKQTSHAGDSKHSECFSSCAAGIDMP